MEMSFAKCESIINTLPIGYYAGRRVKVNLEKEVSTSFYSPMEDMIVISYPIIETRLKQAAEGCDEEEAVRSMLYHEVAHAILTPADNLRNSMQVNVFEDERIESVLRHYFHNVNFRQQLYDLYGGHAPKADSAEKAYYNAVRFGLGTAAVQKEVNRMLKEYAPIMRSTDRWDDTPCCRAYEDDIYRLWRLIEKEFGKEPDAFNEKKGGSEGDGEGEDEGLSAGAEEGEEMMGDPHEVEISQEKLQKMVGASLGSHPNLDDAKVAQLNDFQHKIEVIIGNFNKKNKGGSGINTYSGVFNPRAVARKDYRYFERAMTTQGNNKFGTCHLNLIIDCSGSFYDNEDLTNGILAILSEVERKNRNFTMDVAFINHEFRLCHSVRERKMVADGGNAIPENMKEILMSLQKPQTCNYNIVLFDGDAICQGDYGKDKRKIFRVFDMKQTTLITDSDNEKYMSPPFTSTKVVVTDKYTDELIDNIIRALTIAFG